MFNLFQTFDVSKILYRFQRVIDNLEAAIDYHDSQAYGYKLKIDELDALKTSSYAEAAKAEKIAKKLRELIA